MAIRKIWHLCLVQLKELLLNPTTYIFFCLQFVYFNQYNAPSIRFQQDASITLNAWGYTAGVFSQTGNTLVFGLGCMAMFADLPLIRENALLESTRCSRNVWVGGRILYVFLVGIVYSFLMMIFCLLTSGGNLQITENWGKVLNSIANGYSIGTELPISLTLEQIRNYTPIQAWCLTLAMCIGTSTFIGMLMLFISLIFGRVPALMCAGVVTLLDFVISERLPYWLYRISPLSYTRLTIITSSGSSYYPTVVEAVWSLLAMIALTSILALLVSRQSKAFSGKILAEQY